MHVACVITLEHTRTGMLSTPIGVLCDWLGETSRTHPGIDGISRTDREMAVAARCLMFGLHNNWLPDGDLLLCAAMVLRIPQTVGVGNSWHCHTGCRTYVHNGTCKG